MSTARTLTAHSATEIRLSGGSYPVGWSWRGGKLHHQGGVVVLTPTPEAAARIDAAVKAATPRREEHRRKNMAADVESEWSAGMAAWRAAGGTLATVNGWTYWSVINDSNQICMRSLAAVPGKCDYDTSEMTVTINKR